MENEEAKEFEKRRGEGKKRWRIKPSLKCLEGELKCTNGNEEANLERWQHGGDVRGADGWRKGERSKTSGVMSRTEMPPSLSHISTILITLRNASE